MPIHCFLLEEEEEEKATLTILAFFLPCRP
jgi:hypothetical protein